MQSKSRFTCLHRFGTCIVLLLPLLQWNSWNCSDHGQPWCCNAHVTSEDLFLDGMDDEVVSIRDSAYFDLSLFEANEYLTAEQSGYFLSSNAFNLSVKKLPCQPRHIHLSLGDQKNAKVNDKFNDDGHESASMTISFSIPSHDESGKDGTLSSVHQCNPNLLDVSITYQQEVGRTINTNHQFGVQKEKQSVFVIDHESTLMTSNHENQDNQDTVATSTTRTHAASESSSSMTSVINQYTTKSLLTNETYTSDYIYHVQLNNLKTNTIYSYSIQVESNYEKWNGYHTNKKEAGTDDLNDSVKNKTLKSQKGGVRLHTLTNTMMNIIFNTNSLINTARALYQGLRVKEEVVGKIDESGRRSTKRRENNNYDQNNILGQTPTFTFKTPPSTNLSSLASSSLAGGAKTASRPPTKFAIVGDLGQTYNSSITMSNILAETKPKSNTTTPASIVIIAGDMSYANTIDPQWDTWFDLIEPLISQTPLIVAPGNHEIECDLLTKKPFLPYENRFRMPNRLGAADVGLVEEKYFHMQWGCAASSQFRIKYDYGNAYYSFIYGQIKTIVLSSYSETSAESVQYKWLEDELKNNIDRSITPWVIVVMHTQFYTTFKGHDNEFQTIDMRRTMEPLFYKYGVNVVFSGHDHAYMRSKPMYNWTVDDEGPVYLIVGEGGNREHHVKEYLHDVPEEWVAVRDKTVYGFGTFEVLNETSANWKWIMDANDDNLTFTDDVWFTNQYF